MYLTRPPNMLSWGLSRLQVRVCDTMSNPQPGILALTLSFKALDLAPYNIRVNAVLPWWTDTPMVPIRELKILDDASRMNPMARISQPYEPAGTILFLCSPLATFTTAQGLLLDAGKFEEQSLYEGPKRINFTEAHVE